MANTKHIQQPSLKSFILNVTQLIMVSGQAFLLLSTPVANARAPGARRLPWSYTDPKIPFEPPSLPSFSSLPDIDAASTSSPAIRFDYCALAAVESNANNGIVPYKAAKGCYEMFDFDPNVRDQTVQSVRANLESFYVFYDIAK